MLWDVGRIQGYYTNQDRHAQGMAITLYAASAVLQYRLKAGSRHEIVWGAGLRTDDSRIEGGTSIRFPAPQQADNLFSAFVQDKYRLTNRLSC